MMDKSDIVNGIAISGIVIVAGIAMFRMVDSSQVVIAVVSGLLGYIGRGKVA